MKKIIILKEKDMSKNESQELFFIKILSKELN